MTETAGIADPAVKMAAERAGTAPTPSRPAVTSRWVLLASTAGAAGAAALGASFGVLPAPPKLSSPLTALTHYAANHHHVLLLAAWLEGSGTALYVIFALAMVHLAGASSGLAGRVAALAGAAVLAVSLVYDATLSAIAQSAALGGQQTTTALVSYGLFAGVEHVFLLVPPLLLPLGLILLRTGFCRGSLPGSP